MAPMQGSVSMSNKLKPCAVNSSITFGARTARWALARKRTEGTGAQSPPIFHESVPPPSSYSEWR
ncbi:hypothetical protein D3C80_805360 [compost metagenome]